MTVIAASTLADYRQVGAVTLKERFENNFTLFVLGLMVAGFLAGVGVYKALLELTRLPEVSGGASAENWQEEAKRANWMPNADCPAYPVTISITSPGNGSIVKGPEHSHFETEVVIQSSRPIPDSSQIGIITNIQGDGNYYLDFPSYNTDEKRTIFRIYDFNDFNAEIGRDKVVNLWAILVDNTMKFDQITSSTKDAVLSAHINIALQPQ
jgi:hypothetical protein